MHYYPPTAKAFTTILSGKKPHALGDNMQLKRWLITLFILAIVITSLGWIKFGQIQAAIAFAETFPEPSAAVKSAHVSKYEYSKSIRVVGQLKAPQIMTLRNETQGVITYLGFQPGATVEEGQVLVKLGIAEEQASLNAAKAQVKLYSATYKRLKKLLKQRRVSQEEVDQAEANLAIAQAEAENLQTLIDKKTIKAPFSGQVGLTQYQLGQLLDANSEIIRLVGINDTIWVDFSISQTQPQPSIGDMITVSS
jgi:membrane fusion protein (multidrug efflux system)